MNLETYSKETKRRVWRGAATEKGLKYATQPDTWWVRSHRIYALDGSTRMTSEEPEKDIGKLLTLKEDEYGQIVKDPAFEQFMQMQQGKNKFFGFLTSKQTAILTMSVYGGVSLYDVTGNPVIGLGSSLLIGAVTHKVSGFLEHKIPKKQIKEDFILSKPKLQ